MIDVETGLFVFVATCIIVLISVMIIYNSFLNACYREINELKSALEDCIDDCYQLTLEKEMLMEDLKELKKDE